MKLAEIVQSLHLGELTPELSDTADTEVTQGYASDLLSDVLAHAPAGSMLVTLQVHLNVVAVASHADQCGVIFSSRRQPEDEVIARAVEEGVPLFVTDADTFDVVGRLYQLGIKGHAA
jgi:hypothetical protein